MHSPLCADLDECRTPEAQSVLKQILDEPGNASSDASLPRGAWLSLLGLGTLAGVQEACSDSNEQCHDSVRALPLAVPAPHPARAVNPILGTNNGAEPCGPALCSVRVP